MSTQEINLKTPNPRNGSRLPKIQNTLGNRRVPTQNAPDSDSESQSHIGLKQNIGSGYKMASYTKAVDHLFSQTYTRKITGPDGNSDYEPYQVCVDTQELKQYGLGIYLYLEFVKRLAATFLIMSAINIVPIVYAFSNGTGMQQYTSSYMITLAKTSLGNLQDADGTAYLIFTACDILSMFVLFGFYLHWRSFHAEAIDNDAKDVLSVNPTNYVLSVTGFDPLTSNLQKNLTSYVDQVFPGAYQVEVIYNYSGNFQKFIHYDQLIEKRQKEKQVMIQTGKTSQDFLALEKQIAEFEDELSHIAQVFEPQYAILHFRTLKARNDYVNFCRKYALIDKFSYSLKRFLCCQHLPPPNQLFMRKDALMIKSLNLSTPDQINWPNLDITNCSRIIRWIITIILLVICILITSSLIALCTLYVSSTSACTNFDPNILLTKAQIEGGQTLYCYCAAHFTQIYTNPLIQTACGSISNTILYANLMQVGASLVSSVSNFLLIIMVGIIGKYILKPDSKPKQYSFIFVSVLLSNYINASILPLIMNGDIFGFQSLQYLKFLDFIDFKKVSIFKDYDRDWYAVVGPYYMNFLIIAIISPLINIFITCVTGCLRNWKVKRACQNTDKENPVIQKQANTMITSMVFDLPTQQAIVCLNMIIAVMYSSLLPILLPITLIYLVITFLCKKAIILRYSIRVPADQALSQKIITLMPFILLVHFLMGIWSHTADGIFHISSYIVKLDFAIFGGDLDRVFVDIIMVGAGALILAWIVFDFTIISFFKQLSDCFKDELQIPKKYAALQNRPYQSYIKTTNILGSYKLANNPTYGHAIKAYNQLKKRRQRQNRRTTRDQDSTLNNLSPQKFGQQTMDSTELQRNNEF